MQILIVIGPSWTGTAAHQAGTYVSFWILGTLLLFLPVAAVVQYCVQIWPSVTLLSMLFNLVPIVDVARPWVFALKVGGTVVAINLIATAIYWRGAPAQTTP
jgi:hypothetical protein